MTAPEEPSTAAERSPRTQDTVAPLDAVRRAAESVLGAGAAAVASAGAVTGSTESAATIERPDEQGADGASSDDEVIDGEIVDESDRTDDPDHDSADDDNADDDSAADGNADDDNCADDTDTTDAELVDPVPTAVTPDVPAGTSPDPVAAPDPVPTMPAGTDDTLAGAGVPPAPPVNTVPTVIPAAPVTATPAFDYTDQGVPTLDYLRDKIEGRWGTAMGSTELAEESQAGRQQQDAADERARLAKEKLAEIRRQVDGERSDNQG